MVWTPTPLPNWIAELSPAVETGRFRVPRAVLLDESRAEIEAWLAANLSDGGVAPHVRDALADDILGLTDRLAAHSGVFRFMVRIFTEAPTTECGFHVDTVSPGAPPWGFVRVYNGAGTEFVDPANVVGMAAFYRYLSRRERLERERSQARRQGDPLAYERLEQATVELDRAREFLADPDQVLIAPAGSIVAFKHVDLRFHWAPHAAPQPWIHCSPADGPPRLVVNVTSPQRARRRAR